MINTIKKDRALIVLVILSSVLWAMFSFEESYHKIPMTYEQNQLKCMYVSGVYKRLDQTGENLVVEVVEEPYYSNTSLLIVPDLIDTPYGKVKGDLYVKKALGLEKPVLFIVKKEDGLHFPVITFSAFCK